MERMFLLRDAKYMGSTRWVSTGMHEKDKESYFGRRKEALGLKGVATNAFASLKLMFFNLICPYMS